MGARDSPPRMGSAGRRRDFVTAAACASRVSRSDHRGEARPLHQLRPFREYTAVRFVAVDLDACQTGRLDDLQRACEADPAARATSGDFIGAEVTSEPGWHPSTDHAFGGLNKSKRWLLVSGRCSSMTAAPAEQIDG